MGKLAAKQPRKRSVQPLGGMFHPDVAKQIVREHGVQKVHPGWTGTDEEYLASYQLEWDKFVAAEEASAKAE